MKRTKWFNFNQTPVRLGLYEVKGNKNWIFKATWDGEGWYWTCQSVKIYFVPNKWRGLVASS